MKPKKKKLIGKLVKKNYNNELEHVLDNKVFDEYAKNTLLSILYKIEASYDDLKTVKQNVETKEEYINSFIEIIKKECESIKILKMSENNGQIPEKKTYIINKEEKQIISYPIERKLLYAIYKLSNKEKIIKDEYFLIDETLSELINVGSNINRVEPLRDFNGYSWTTLPQEIESIDHNLVYQNLRILIGYKFLNRWRKNNEFIIDYFDLFKEKIENQYGKENKEKLIDIIEKISILLNVKFNKDNYKKFNEMKEEVEDRLASISDRKEFIEKITQKKIDLRLKLIKIDSIINNKELLNKEYHKRNENLPLDKKIFSMKILSKRLVNEKKEIENELKELNGVLNPKKFINYQDKLENKYDILKILNDDIEEELDNFKIELQKIFLSLLNIKIKNAETKEEIEQLIFEFRYYLVLQYDYDRKIKDVEELQEKINITIKNIIDKAIKLDEIEPIEDNKNVNYEIFKNLFYTRIINIKDVSFEVIKEKGKFYIRVFDEDILEEKKELENIQSGTFPKRTALQ